MHGGGGGHTDRPRAGPTRGAAPQSSGASRRARQPHGFGGGVSGVLPLPPPAPLIAPAGPWPAPRQPCEQHRNNTSGHKGPLPWGLQIAPGGREGFMAPLK